MSETPRPVRGWWEFDGTRVFGREVQQRFAPDRAETWRYSYHPTGPDGNEHEHYGYQGFEMPAVPTPLRSLRILLSTGHTLHLGRGYAGVGWGWIVQKGSSHASGDFIDSPDVEAVTCALAEAVAWIQDQEGVTA